MSVFFSSEPPDDPRIADVWTLLESELFEDAVYLASLVCQEDDDAPLEIYCGLSLAYGELGLYADADRVARAVVGGGETHWRARHALAVALMHQGRMLGALDTLGFHREPVEIFIVRAQIERRGGFVDSLKVTLEDALQKSAPPPIRLLLAYLYSTLSNEIAHWPSPTTAHAEIIRQADYLDVWQRDAERHTASPYGEQLFRQIEEIQRLIR
jgi:hypothetical protein